MPLSPACLLTIHPPLFSTQLGAKGSGKTAFLQTLTSVLTLSPPPTAGGDANPLQPTLELDRVNIAKLVAGQEGRFARPLNFRVFDLWGKCLYVYTGWCCVGRTDRPSPPCNNTLTQTTTIGTDASADSNELPHILAGKAPLGFSASHTTATLSAEDQADLAATLSQRAADGALFFVGAGDVNDAGKMEALKAAFESSKAALGGHAPLVVLGHGDAVEGKLLAEPLNWSSKKVGGYTCGRRGVVTHSICSEPHYSSPQPLNSNNYHQQIATLRKRLATAFGVSWAQTVVAVPYAALPLKPQGAARPLSVRSAAMGVCYV